MNTKKLLTIAVACSISSYAPFAATIRAVISASVTTGSHSAPAITATCDLATTDGQAQALNTLANNTIFT
jgi:hypothetical protein